MNDTTLLVSGILLVTVPTIAFGGAFLLRLASGGIEATAEQRASFRAGHAHAGVLVVLSLVALLYIDGAPITGAPAAVATICIPAAPILLPAGFFLSMIGAQRRRPNRLFVLIPLGALSLAVGTLTLGIALLLT